MINHAALSSRRNPANASIVIFSLANPCHSCCRPSSPPSESIGLYIIVSAVNDVEPIARTLGQLKANALHVPALSGADIDVNFNQLDKATWLKIFMKSGSYIIGALKQVLVAANETSERKMTMLASFVCDAYCPNGIEIRRMFCKQMAESNRLPSTSGTLKQNILRVHVHARICDNMTLSPLQNGFCEDANGDLVSHTTDDLPAPTTIIEMDNCPCRISCSSQR